MADLDDVTWNPPHLHKWRVKSYFSSKIGPGDRAGGTRIESKIISRSHPISKSSAMSHSKHTSKREEKKEVCYRNLLSCRVEHLAFALAIGAYKSVKNRWAAVPLEYPDVPNINQSFSPERQKYRSYSNALLFWRYLESWRKQDFHANQPVVRYLVLSAYVYASSQARKNPKYSNKTPRQSSAILRHLEHVGQLTYVEFREL